MAALTALPTHLLQAILSTSGHGAPAAAITCKALSVVWRSALTVVPLVARYLLARYGALTAARHMYTLSHHSQLLRTSRAKEQDQIMLNLLHHLCQAGAEIGLHDALLLMRASRAGHIFMVSELLHMARPSSFALSRALTAAAETGHSDIVGILLKAGALPTAYQSAALVAAAAGGNCEIVYLLCAAGADPTADSSRALRRAIQLGHVEAAKVLLLYGADARALCSAALVHACELPPAVAPDREGSTNSSNNSRKENRSPERPHQTGGGAASTRALGEDPNPKTGAAGSAPIAAAAAAPADDGSGSSITESPLVCDGERQALALVEVLLRAGADARSHGRAALEAAAARGYVAVVGALLAAGADPTACSSSALVAASIQGNMGVVSMLLESGADPWDVTELALHMASERGHRPVLHAIRAAQMSVGTGEKFPFGSSGGTGGSTTACEGSGGASIGVGGCYTPTAMATASSRWSVATAATSAAASRWSLHVTAHSDVASVAMMRSGGAMEAFLSNR